MTGVVQKLPPERPEAPPPGSAVVRVLGGVFLVIGVVFGYGIASATYHDGHVHLRGVKAEGGGYLEVVDRDREAPSTRRLPLADIMHFADNDHFVDEGYTQEFDGPVIYAETNEHGFEPVLWGPGTSPEQITALNAFLKDASAHEIRLGDMPWDSMDGKVGFVIAAFIALMFGGTGLRAVVTGRNN